MKRQISIAAFAALMSANLMSSGCQGFDSATLIDTGAEIATQALSGSLQGKNSLAVRDMLNLSGDRASTYLSNQGSWDNILPESVQSYLPLIKAMDTNNYLTKIESSMQDSATKAALAAGPIFKSTLSNMTITDALGILQGGDSAATNFFQERTQDKLNDEFLTIIKSNLSKTGFYENYSKFESLYNMVPGTKDKPLQLENRLSERVLEGMYAEMANQEKLIRQDPVGRGSQLISSALDAVNTKN